MAHEFHELHAFQPVDAGTLQLPHSVALLSAIRHVKDVILVQALRAAEGASEALVVDVDCDEMPNRNPIGLLSPERLAIIVRAEGTRPPSVFALRKDFPNAMHINSAPIGDPRSLCLYFEPPRAVMRSWTAPKFLRRIQWWLEATARGTLHPSDQPVELPFFDSGWEVVVPENFEALWRQPNADFHLRLIEPSHLDGSHTLRVRLGAANNGAPRIGFVVIDCPPIVQGTRTEVPATLGSLSDELAGRGLNLLKILRQSLQQQLAGGGEPKTNNQDRFVIILCIPVCRSEGVAPERTQRFALLTLMNRVDLGLAIGAYWQHDGMVFNDTPIGGVERLPAEHWQSIEILPAAVLEEPGTKSLRYYSAIAGDSPDNATLVGLGALGSELLNLWTRAGWGTWTLVDSDHIKPHNLARHHAYSAHIGLPKVAASAALANSVRGTSVVAGEIVADACDDTNDKLHKALSQASLVVDCSTTLDFPRIASASAIAARHVSAFLTPNGNASVLLYEDSDRQIRLRSLEAQYYRALLANAWGEGHLEGNLGSFWSGASCRDVSYRLPHSSIVIHAGLLAEQIVQRYQARNASIAIWQRDPRTGSISAFEVPAHTEISRQVMGFSIRTDEGLEEKLRQMRAECLPNETGGILIGYHDLTRKEITVVDALPPPPDSGKSESYFDRGAAGLLKAYNDVMRRTANVVGYIGEWHSHPRNHGAKQSGADILQLFKLTIGMAEDGLPFLQLIVGERAIETYIGEARQ